MIFVLLSLLCLGPHLRAAGRISLGWVLGIGVVICWFGLLATGLAAYRFRCPRCGNRFAFPSSAWPTNHCKHCNFDLGPASMA